MSSELSSVENNPGLWLDALPGPETDHHKYHRGHVLVAGGGLARTGAARLAAISALRIGAGLVTIASPGNALSTYASHLTAVMLERADHAEALRQIIDDGRYTACAVGPAFGTDDLARQKVHALLETELPIVLDADALSMWEADPDELFTAIKAGQRPVVMTPHEGEFARLFGKLETETREQCAFDAAKESGSVVVLKGSETVITDGHRTLVVNRHATPYLATAGSGDVLTGMIAGLLAGGMAAIDAACAAVWMHGDAGLRFGPGLISEDLPDLIPEVLKQFAG